MVLEYKDSAFRFTDPVRLFKENDPYYFEVDNIPLKQLQENCLWLKDQLGAVAGSNFAGEVKRKNLEELRPYATGEDRIVRVKPGRYTARINDAYSRDPLALIEQIGNLNNNEQGFYGGDSWRSTNLGVNELADNIDTSSLYTILEKFKSNLAQDALGCDGLIGRTFTWPTYTETDPAEGDGAQIGPVEDGSLGYQGAALNKLLFPIARVSGFTLFDNPGRFSFLFGGWWEDYQGYQYLPYAEAELLKKWRGVARNAIVDIDSELEIEVPPFNPEDFNYTDRNGNTQAVNNVQSRIDLVFIYSKPIDRTEATILKHDSIETITKPALGIVKGAGIRVNYASVGDGNDGNNGPHDRYQSVGDNHSILASPADQFNENLGFTATSANDIIVDTHGSFPAPDDILNLAPLISDRLETEAYELIGQSILPVAYVFVQGTGGVAITPIQQSDVIDIRPFFRTAELTYNERVGVAAAVPPLSIANPAVGKGQLDRTAQNLKTYIDAQVNQSEETTTPTQKILATGTVLGGLKYGPEGALYNFYSRQDNGLTEAELRNLISGKYGYPGGAGFGNIDFPTLPQWDRNSVIRTGNTDATYGTSVGFAGQAYKGYINTFAGGGQDRGTDDTGIVAGTLKNTAAVYQNWSGAGTPEYDKAVNRNQRFIGADAGGNNISKTKFNYVRKKIQFNRPADLYDYHIDVSLMNCLPITYPGNNESRMDTQANHTGVFVEKGYDYFIIYVAYSTDSLGDGEGTDRMKDIYDDGNYQGFFVLTEDIEISKPASHGGDRGYAGNPSVASCAVPSVSWVFTGISNQGSTYNYNNLNGTDPTIGLDSF